MNIVRHELKAGLKPFLFWTLGLAFLIFAGMTKFLGFGNGGTDISAVLDRFPKIFLVMFGMAGADVQSLGGYYSVLQFFVLICSSIFAIHLGTNAVSRETIDKTYEFVFTKPRTRKRILGCKLLAGLIYLAVFCALNLLFSFISLPALGIANTIPAVIARYALSSFFVELVFFSLAAMLSALFTRAEIGIRVSNAVFLITYILSVLYDLSENPGLIRLFTPLKYFTASDLTAGLIDIRYFAVCIIITAGALCCAFRAFSRKDLRAA